MNPNKNCILFDGGKRIQFSNAGGNGITFSRDDTNKSWTVKIELKIDALEAEKVIHKYGDLPAVPEEKFAEIYPNLVFFEAFENNGDPKLVELQNSFFAPIFDRNDYGEINIKFRIEGMGKTQNPKTQNPTI